MKLTVLNNPELPRLAWCAVISEDGIFVHCGLWVEHGEGYFFEGVWNGSLEEPASATICVASGATVSDQGAMFFTPTHTLGKIHAIHKGGKLFLSNSLAFLFSASGEIYSKKYLFYEYDLNSIYRGLRKARKSVPTASGLSIHLFYHCNILVDNELKMTTIPKRPPDRFEDFGSYYGFLRDGLKALDQNAERYRPLATLSKGYDSVACAALSLKVGCREAITFNDPDQDDSGEEIGLSLGLETTVYEREAYKRSTDFVEAEFQALGTRGGDVYLSAAEKQLEGSLLITGFHGDKVWDKSAKSVSTDIVRGDTSGADLEEIRLRCGFIHIPIPFFGCLRHPDTRRISISTEMVPWSIGGGYDRPIPRRIAEEAGVPRELFGQKKSVMSVVVGEPQLEWYFSETLYRDLERFGSPLLRAPVTFHIIRMWTALIQAVSEQLGKVSWRLQTIIKFLMPPSGRYNRGLSLVRFRFHWGMDKTMQRYRRACPNGDVHCR